MRPTSCLECGNDIIFRNGQRGQYPTRCRECYVRWRKKRKKEVGYSTCACGRIKTKSAVLCRQCRDRVSVKRVEFSRCVRCQVEFSARRGKKWCSFKCWLEGVREKPICMIAPHLKLRDKACKHCGGSFRGTKGKSVCHRSGCVQAGINQRIAEIRRKKDESMRGMVIGLRRCRCGGMIRASKERCRKCAQARVRREKTSISCALCDSAWTAFPSMSPRFCSRCQKHMRKYSHIWSGVKDPALRSELIRAAVELKKTNRLNNELCQLASNV